MAQQQNSVNTTQASKVWGQGQETMHNYWKIHIFLSLLVALIGCDVNVGNDSVQTTDAGVLDFPIAYISRPIPFDEEGERKPYDVLNPADFNPGAKLIVKDRASVPAESIVITAGLFTPAEGETEAQYDVKDLSVSPDGTKLLFAMRAPEDPDADEEDQPKWNIWEYELASDQIYPIISEPLFAEEGDDVTPYYLPSGEIVFSSNRQDTSKAILLDEQKPQFIAQRESSDDDQNEDIFNIHTMSADGNDIRQITFNQNQDIHPRVLQSGEIVFLRRDSYEGNNEHTSLYRINPDGSNLSLYYGYHSQNTGTEDTTAVFSTPKLLPDGKLMVLLRSPMIESWGGDIVVIDTQNYTEITQPIAANSGASGPAQISITPTDTATDDRISVGGSYSSAHLIDDGTNRLFVSWNPCMVDGYKLGIYIDSNLQLINDQGEFVNEDGDSTATPVAIAIDEIRPQPCTTNALNLLDIQIAEPLYGIWIYDPDTETQTPVTLATTNIMYTDAVVFDTRAEGEGSPSSSLDSELIEQKLGIMHIRSVYDLDGVDSTDNGIAAMSDPLQTPTEERTARFIRLIKAVSLPSEDFLDFDRQSIGFGGVSQIKDIMGYVPIEPDGSAKFLVPANVAFSISILDGEGRKLDNNNGGRHRNWLTVREGETYECQGCHSGDSEAPHGRLDAQTISANSGASGSFPNTALPNIDANNNLVDVGFPFDGETMAEYYARTLGPRKPSLNLTFTDDWSDDSVDGVTKAASFDWNFADLLTLAPVPVAVCANTWEAFCRTIINYPEHIQPIWEIEHDIGGENLACVSCHDRNNFPLDISGMYTTQLELTSAVSPDNALFSTSYVELLRNNLILELNPNSGLVAPISGTAISRDPDTNAVIYETTEEVILGENGEDDVIITIPVVDSGNNPVPEVGPIVCDANTDDITRLILANSVTGTESTSELIQYLTTGSIYTNDPMASFVIDSIGDRIELTETKTCTTGALLNAGSARGTRSQAFFNLFNSTGSHAGYLNQAELKLLTEWIDIGANYYNDPFAAPLD